MEDRYMTQHPEGKSGVNISRLKYEQVRETLLEVLKSEGPLAFSELAEKAAELLEERHFHGSPGWYVTTVKLDLEARQEIERFRKDGRQYLRLTG